MSIHDGEGSRGWNTRVMDTALTRRLLLALADGLQEDGSDQVTGVSIRQGWGGIIDIRIHSTVASLEGRAALGSRLKDAVLEIVGTRRHGFHFEFEPSTAGCYERDG